MRKRERNRERKREIKREKEKESAHITLNMWDENASQGLGYGRLSF